MYQRGMFPYKTYAPTLYQFGSCLKSWAKRALDLIAHDKIIAVGCSVGGSCALEITALAESRVEALVLIGTKAAHNPDPEMHSCLVESVRSKGTESAWHEIWEPHFYNTTNERTFDKARGIAIKQQEAQLICGLSAFHTRPDRKDFVASLDIPIHVVSGDHDVLPGPKKSADLAALAPKGQLHTIPECGHYVPLEQPKYFNAILTEVIDAQKV